MSNTPRVLRCLNALEKWYVLDGPMPPDVTALARELERESARRLAIIVELYDALEAEAKASLTLTTALENYSDPSVEARQHERAMLRASAAHAAARAEVEAAQPEGKNG